MKKLNRKGFTLIELLAVIVILAIILVVTVPNIISSINDARVSSIHNLAKSAANTYNTAYGQDLVATTDANKLLGDIPESVSSTVWTCIGDLKNTSTGGKSLSEILGLQAADLKLVGTAPTIGSTTGAATMTEAEAAAISAETTCSAIRIYNGSAQILLVAEKGGKFYVAQKETFALSTESAGRQNTATAS